MLKHYISNYAVVRSSITSPDTLSTNDDDFYLLEAMMGYHPNSSIENIDNSNSLIFNIQNIEFLQYEIENENIKKQKLLNIKDGICIKIPGLPLLPGIIKLTNYRLIFKPFQIGFVKFKCYTNYFEIPLGSIFNVISNNIDINHHENILHQQLLSYNYQNNNFNDNHNKITPKQQNVKTSSTKHLDIKSPQSPQQISPNNTKIDSNNDNNNNNNNNNKNSKPLINLKNKGFLYKNELEIMTKDGRRITFLFANIKQDKFNAFVAEIRRSTFTRNIEETFAVKSGILSQKENNKQDKIFDDGWNVYNFFKEFTRQKIPLQFKNDTGKNNNSNKQIKIKKKKKILENIENKSRI